MKKGKKQAKKLAVRRADYSRMMLQLQIGNGHRDANAYRRPGSNKK